MFLGVRYESTGIDGVLADRADDNGMDGIKVAVDVLERCFGDFGVEA